MQGGFIVKSSYFTGKIETRLEESYACFWCETKTGEVRTSVFFEDAPKFSHVTEKVSARAFH